MVSYQPPSPPSPPLTQDGKTLAGTRLVRLHQLNARLLWVVGVLKNLMQPCTQGGVTPW